MMLNWLIAAVVLYSGFVALLYMAQRSLQYFPERGRTAPWTVSLTEAEEVVLDTADGERVIVWHVPPHEDRPVFLYFHGNGGSLRWRVERFRALTADGSGLVALSYRGYGGSSGRPAETGLIKDAEAAYAFAIARYPAQRIVLWGESLGLRSRWRWQRKSRSGTWYSRPLSPRPPMWFVPVRLFMKDPFRSDLRVSKVTAPVLVVHGENDAIVPITLGERLYGVIRAPKRFVRVAD